MKNYNQIAKDRIGQDPTEKIREFIKVYKLPKMAAERLISNK